MTRSILQVVIVLALAVTSSVGSGCRGAGEQAEIRVAYLPVPELAWRAVAQRYTCLAPRGAAGGRYRYEGVFRDFTAELPVDADGLVMDYPETFRRVWPT